MSARARLWLDLALFGALFLAYNPAWTGVAVHEWLSVIVFVPLLFHVVVNWDQTLAILRRLEGRLRATPKVNLVVDIALFVVAVTVVLSGLLISQSVARALGIIIVPDSLWMRMHAWSADATILLLLVHFALHWRWVVNCAQRLVRRDRACRNDPAVAIRRETRRLEKQLPAPPLQYATVPARRDDRPRI